MANEYFTDKRSYFHSFSRAFSAGGQNFVDQAPLKSGHNLDMTSVRAEEIPFIDANYNIVAPAGTTFEEFDGESILTGSVGSRGVRSEFANLLKFYDGVNLTVQTGTNNETWYINDGGIVNDFIDPTDKFSPDGSATADGYTAFLLDKNRSKIASTATNWTFDPYNGRIQFVKGDTPTQHSAWGNIKLLAFAYIGKKLENRVAELQNAIDTIEFGGASSALTGIVKDDDSAISIANTNSHERKIGLTLANDGILSQSASGLSAAISLSAITQSEDSTWASQYALVGKNGQALGATINIPKDQFLSDAEFGYSTSMSTPSSGWDLTKTSSRKYPTLKLTFELSGSKEPVYIPVNNLVDTYTAGSGLAVTNNDFSINLADGNESFLTVDENGLKLDGVQDAIDNAVNNLYDAANSSGAVYDSIKEINSSLTGYSSSNTVSSAISNINTILNGFNTSNTVSSVLQNVANNSFKGVEESNSISGTLDNESRKITLDVKKSADANNAIQIKNDGLYVPTYDYTYTPNLANGSTSGVVYSGADVSIANGQITVNQASKVKNSIEIFDFTFDGSASAQISAGYGLNSNLVGNVDTVSVDTTTIATRDYVEQVSLLVASAVASSGDLTFWEGLSGLVEQVSALNVQIKAFTTTPEESEEP